ncbi:hypothetical protein TanjilG_24827 [Lupinus angustifolius]|uniref:Uncharacterized protein n=1 Tax=Lupinus angustifolius TaxID=3871 RepID=A0A394D862_LUPAN|nr:PREDICTED: uncharacterized protein LOC109337394 [Lupinus angustifolius]OIW19840.1 hypothetical protein TanjilG_24827 [Lupinus angustifolius]
MENNALLRLLVILLSLYCVVYVAAVPATRSSMIRKMVPSSVQDHIPKENLAVGLKNNDEEFDMEEGVIENRMMLDVADYPGTRANPAHHPKAPGKH